MTSPCKDCTDRMEGCRCEQYLKWKAEEKAVKESMRRENTWMTQYVDRPRANRAWSSGRHKR